MIEELNPENFERRLKSAREGLTPELRGQLEELAQQAVDEGVFALTEEMLRGIGGQVEDAYDLAELCGQVNDIFYAYYGL